MPKTFDRANRRVREYRVSEAHRRVIDIRTVSPPAVLEVGMATVVPPFSVPVYVSKWFPLHRGPVAMEIEMPARANVRPVIILCLVMLIPLSFFAVTAYGLHFDPKDFATLGLPVLFACLMFALLMGIGLYSPFARSETLEIDSEIVALRRGRRYVASWTRATFDDVRLAVPGERFSLIGASAFGRRPTLIWGFYDDGVSCVGGAGSGISQDVAARILAEIEIFCATHATDPDSQRRLSAWVPRGWSA
jgi:hypothetical protein